MNKQTKLIIAASLLIGFIAGYAVVSIESETGPATVTAPVQPEAEPLFYRNPMDPNITSPVPAKDHMGMDYIPVFADDTAGPAGTVIVDPVTVQSMGVRTTTATHADISRQVVTVGRIGYDETTIYRLHPKTEGWIEELRVQTTGEQIDQDEILLSLYSPQLVATEQEYLISLAALEQLPATASSESRLSAERLVDIARQRLELLDVPAHQITEIEKSRKAIRELHIHAPVAGTVIKVGARRGQHVTPMTELYFIADLSRVWVYVDIFEDELPWVKVGDTARMTLTGLPGVTFEGDLTYIYPYAERSTRTIKARLEFTNKEGLLKPDMLADIVIDVQAARHVLVVPEEAVMKTGRRALVFVETAPGRFEPREVTTGVSGNGMTRILAGVKLNEQVVTSAQFLIDSESKLREAAAKMMNARQSRQAPAMTTMEGHQHD